MNVASKDLSAELYKVSRWYEKNMFTWANDYSNGFALSYGGPDEIESKHFKGNYFPAYDGGYLLRKLPESIKDASFIAAWLSMDNLGSHGWQFSYRKGAAKPEIKAIADTPEDALAKLAIELFKQGILVKEGK